MADPIDVSGGSAGVHAQCDEIRFLAGRLGAAAGEIGMAALALHAYLADPAITVSGAVAPHELMCFEADLLDALDGPVGLSWCAAELGVVDVELRAAAAAYEGADRLSASAVVRGLARLPTATLAASASLVMTGNPMTAGQMLLGIDPDLTDVLVHALGTSTLAGAATVLFPDGTPVVTPTGIDQLGEARRPPRSLRDVVEGLDRRNHGPHGAIDVRILSGNGARRVIVDITGTKSANPLPSRDVTGLLTDARALHGRTTTYERGVLAAMQRAGVRPDDEVMIVGHSEGGMVAMTAARDAARTQQFTVTHVVTVGSPIALTAGQVPRGVQVLALENALDLVPHLDGATNPDRRNVTTVTGGTDCTGIVACHAIADGYEPLAAAVDVSANRSLREFMASSERFRNATHVETNTYVITRDP